MTAHRINEALDRLGQLPRGWDGHGGDPISWKAIAEARRFARALEQSGHLVDCKPAVVPGAGGQVQFEWHAGTLHLEVEFEADGGCAFLLTVDGIDYEGRDMVAQTIDLARAFIVTAAHDRAAKAAP